jgi:RNA polymerase sigma-70 factor (ECF subfamily)
VAADLLARAHAERPASWLSDAIFLAHARATGVPDAELHAGDLYLACACLHAVPDALAALEREHFERLRAKLLVADSPDAPARIATYSGRGSLGGWIRVAAVRLARDIARSERAHARRDENSDLDAHQLDPELGYLKRAYGRAVSDAVQSALAALDGDARTLLKMHYVDGLTIEQVGLAFGKSRATSARMLAAARLALVADIRARLTATVGVRPEEADSLLAFVRSRLDVSIARAFGTV